METLIRGTAPPRPQCLFGLQAQFANPRRPRPDERVDLPEIQESTRVSFSHGVAVQGTLPTRSGVDLYRAVEQLQPPANMQNALSSRLIAGDARRIGSRGTGLVKRS